MSQPSPEQPDANNAASGAGSSADASFGNVPNAQPEKDSRNLRCDQRREANHSRRRFTFGILMLIVGAAVLASNMGVMIPYEWWTLWPWLLVGLGLAQFAVPGTWYERFGGYWLLIVGIYGLISTYHFLGLNWGTAWPVFVIGVGLRIVVGGIFRHERD